MIMRVIKLNWHSLTLIAVAANIILSVSAVAEEAASSLGELKGDSLFAGVSKDQDFGKLPTNISSDTLTLNAKRRIFIYKGNVVVTQGEMKLTSRLIEGSYNEANEIQKIVARGDVVITKLEIRATGQTAVYDAVSGVVTLTDNPQVQQGESVLVADRIKIFLNEDRSQAEGNVRVTFVKATPTAAAAAVAAAAAEGSTPEAAGEGLVKVAIPTKAAAEERSGMIGKK